MRAAPCTPGAPRIASNLPSTTASRSSLGPPANWPFKGTYFATTTDSLLPDLSPSHVSDRRRGPLLVLRGWRGLPDSSCSCHWWALNANSFPTIAAKGSLATVNSRG